MPVLVRPTCKPVVYLSCSLCVIWPGAIADEGVPLSHPNDFSTLRAFETTTDSLRDSRGSGHEGIVHRSLHVIHFHDACVVDQYIEFWMMLNKELVTDVMLMEFRQIHSDVLATAGAFSLCWTQVRPIASEFTVAIIT